MRKSKKYVLIDVGNHYVKCLVIGETSQREYELLKNFTARTRGIENGETKDVVSFREVLEKVISEVEEVAKLETSEIVVSTSCGKFNLRSVEKEVVLSENEKKPIDETTVEQLREAILDEFQTTERPLHIFAKRYIIDKSKVVFNPQDMLANSLAAEFNLVTVERSSGSVLDFLEETFPPETDFAVSVISACEGILTDIEKETGTCVIDLGYSSTSVTIYSHGVPIRLEFIPLGIKHVIKDISFVLNTSLDEAERLLKTHGCAVFGETSFVQQTIEYKGLDGMTAKTTTKDFLSRIIHARLREILTKARRIYREETSKFSEIGLKGLPGGIILSGGGAKVPRLLDVAIDVFKNPVRIGTYNTSSNVQIKNADEVIDEPLYNAALGNFVSIISRHQIKPQAKKKVASESFFKKLSDILKNLW
ncbi:cell division protein FtsA [Pseudothermotoga thermarum]|uniref:Cell division protein FtsA n=1 Tax=Pseudothermotoga thermarum DSM 5069 TaxID=688269 RepID=F7YUA5_9THEM|nr:cell division protein FtsA [Pseudothermotoga thermarum]AEH51304.1 cell division protein FtsA [Pseudothermotoga thermarum DSM 5069]